MVPPGATCLGVEYFCFEGDDLWTMDEDEAVALAARELASIGLIDPARVTGGVRVRVPKSYPMYDADYAGHVQTIRDHLAGFANVQTCGRNGLHRYNNQDHSMWTGALAALNLIDGAGHDVWSVNTEARYLESARPSRPRSSPAAQPRRAWPPPAADPQAARAPARASSNARARSSTCVRGEYRARPGPRRRGPARARERRAGEHVGSREASAPRRPAGRAGPPRQARRCRAGRRGRRR